MKITNKVTDESYIQWIERFVMDVLEQANIIANEVVIEDIEHSKRIFVTVDGQEYIIRTWNFIPLASDDSGFQIAEIVEYTLYRTVDGENGGGHGEYVDDGRIRIDWVNEGTEYKLIQLINDGSEKFSAKELFTIPKDKGEINPLNKELETYLTDKLREMDAQYDEYPIVRFVDGNFEKAEGVMFYFDKDSFLDCAEHDFRVMCEIAYQSN